MQRESWRRKHHSVSLYISLEMNGLPGCPWWPGPRCHIVAIGPARWWLSLSSACVTAWALCLSARPPHTPHPPIHLLSDPLRCHLAPRDLARYGSHDCVTYWTSCSELSSLPVVPHCPSCSEQNPPPFLKVAHLWPLFFFFFGKQHLNRNLNQCNFPFAVISVFKSHWYFPFEDILPCV